MVRAKVVKNVDNSALNWFCYDTATQDQGRDSHCFSYKEP